MIQFLVSGCSRVLHHFWPSVLVRGSVSVLWQPQTIQTSAQEDSIAHTGGADGLKQIAVCALSISVSQLPRSKGPDVHTTLKASAARFIYIT